MLRKSLSASAREKKGQRFKFEAQLIEKCSIDGDGGDDDEYETIKNKEKFNLNAKGPILAASNIEIWNRIKEIAIPRHHPYLSGVT